MISELSTLMCRVPFVLSEFGDAQWLGLCVGALQGPHPPLPSAPPHNLPFPDIRKEGKMERREREGGRKDGKKAGRDGGREGVGRREGEEATSSGFCGLWGVGEHILSALWPWEAVYRGNLLASSFRGHACSALGGRLDSEDFPKNLWGSYSEPLISLLRIGCRGGSVYWVFCTIFHQSWGPSKAGMAAHLSHFCPQYFRLTFAEFF